MAEDKKTAEPAKQAKLEKSVIVYPHLTEKSMNMVELQNKLVFIVDNKANKKEIREAVERDFGVKVEWVRTEITQKGKKKAYVKLNPESSASDVASQLGMI